MNKKVNVCCPLCSVSCKPPMLNKFLIEIFPETDLVIKLTTLLKFYCMFTFRINDPVTVLFCVHFQNNHPVEVLFHVHFQNNIY